MMKSVRLAPAKGCSRDENEQPSSALRLSHPASTGLRQNAAADLASSRSSPASAGFWRDCLYRFINALYFCRISIVNPQSFLGSGPILFVGLHRNGAVDGFVYYQALQKPVFMISTQLLRNWFARVFFTGIAVSRQKDEGDRRMNSAAIDHCVQHLSSGGNLCIFPQGTSSLGPRHLPLKTGAIWIILRYLELGGPPLRIVPVGIHYKSAPAFRSEVEVVLGSQVSTEFPTDSTMSQQLRIMKRRMEAAFEEISVNVGSENYQSRIEQLACAATLGTNRSYFKSLKALEQAIPEPILSSVRNLDAAASRQRLLLHQGVPLFPTRSAWVHALLLCFLSPVVLAAITLNFPAFAGAWFAGRKIADARNVVSLWKILVGVPAFLFWFPATILALTFHPIAVIGYVGITLAGLLFYRRVKKLAVGVGNAWLHRKLREPALVLYRTILASLPQ
jgi:1-acyl-sn-glycerol-3-phosphate acyltransferase